VVEKIAGRNSVLEAAKVYGSSIDNIFIAAGSSGDRLEEIRRLAGKKSITCQEISKNELDRMVSKNQGVVAVIEKLQTLGFNELLARPSNGPYRRLILLDQVQDPVNLGKIMRTALFFGVDGIIKTSHATAPLSSTVIKVSAGAAVRMPVAKVTNLRRAIEKLKEERFWIAGAVMDGNCRPEEVDTERHLAFIVGHEGKGLRRLTRENCDYLVTIPGSGKFDSLNVGVAAGILTYLFQPDV
jgi:23S rRNA (guanosine2251-2'-O)-methyltransferase